MEIAVDRVVRLQHGGAPPDRRRQGGQEPVRAAVQHGPAAHGAVRLDAGPDVRPVGLDGGAVVAAEGADEPGQRFGPAVHERGGQRRARRSRPGSATALTDRPVCPLPEAEAGHQLQLGVDAVEGGVAQRLHSGVEPEGLRAFLGGRQEIREIPPGRNDRRQQLRFAIQPRPGFRTPFSEHRRSAPVPEPVKTENGFPQRVRSRGHPHARKVEPGHMDPQHFSPTCCIRNYPYQRVCGSSQEVTTGFRPEVKGLAPFRFTDEAVRRRVRIRRAPDERMKAVGGFVCSAAVGGGAAPYPTGVSRVRFMGGDP